MRSAQIKSDVQSAAAGCAVLSWLAVGLTLLKLGGWLSWPWFLVLLPVTFPVLFFAAVGAIVFGGLAAVFFVELIANGIRS